MKISQTTTITGAPVFPKIQIGPDTPGTDALIELRNDNEIDFLSIEELAELRIALTEALAQAHKVRAQLAAPTPESEPAKPVRLFMPGQQLDGTEDLPQGTVIRDNEDDLWGLGSKGWSTGNHLDGNVTPLSIIKDYSPVTIESLPGGES